MNPFRIAVLPHSLPCEHAQARASPWLNKMVFSPAGLPHHHEMELDVVSGQRRCGLQRVGGNCTKSTSPTAPPPWPASASPDRDATAGSRHHSSAEGRRHEQHLLVPYIGFAWPSASDLPVRGCTPHAPRVVGAPPKIAPPPFALAWSPASQWAWLAVGEE